MKRFWRSSVLALAIALSTHPAAAQDKPEVSKLRLAVGGKSAIFYLPLSVTERQAEFLQVALGKVTEHIPVDPLRGKLRSVPTEANLHQPCRQIVGHRRVSGVSSRTMIGEVTQLVHAPWRARSTNHCMMRRPGMARVSRGIA